MTTLDDTQESINSADSYSTASSNTDHLESLIEEVRKIRPELFQFMYSYGNQREEIELLEEQNAELETKIAELTVVQPEASFSYVSTSNNGSFSPFPEKRTSAEELSTEITRASDTLSNLLEFARRQPSIDQGKCYDDILKDIRNELDSVKCACKDLEKLYEDEQRKLSLAREQNIALRRRLSIAEKTHLKNFASGDASVIAESPPPLPHLTVLERVSAQQNLVVVAVSLLINEREPMIMEMDSRSTLPRTKFCVKEGTQYKISVDFLVRKDTIKGLRYIHKVNRMHVNLSKTVYKLGSFSPRAEKQGFTLQPEAAPEGVFHRGKYTIKSQLVDENQQNLMTWCWTLKVVKKW